MSRIISKLLVDSNYQVEQFSDIEIEAVEKLIPVKKNKKGEDVCTTPKKLDTKSNDWRSVPYRKYLPFYRQGEYPCIKTM